MCASDQHPKQQCAHTEKCACECRVVSCRHRPDSPFIIRSCASALTWPTRLHTFITVYLLTCISSRLNNMSIEEKITQGEKLKEEGNQLFKQGQIKEGM
jgi:hypothetical protein